MWTTMRNWLSLADYFAAKNRATEKIVTRLARNNALFQGGAIMDEAELRRKSEKADDAMRRLERRFPDK